MGVVISVDRSLALDRDQYFPLAECKSLIVLHNTAGPTAAGAVNHWRSNPDRIGTAYVIDTDGTIYEVFDPRCWAHHLGLRWGDKTYSQDRRSIGIELANWGPLTFRDGKLYTYLDREYCSGLQTYLWQASEPWRGYTHWARYPATQIAACRALVQHLAQTFSIPMAYPWTRLHDTLEPEFLMTYSGVLAHHHFRSDKFDVGPAFPWSEVLR